MPKFRKKPVEVEAFRFTGWTGFQHYAPEWFRGSPDFDAIGAGVFYPDGLTSPHPHVACVIRTLEGKMRAECGDWIIRGVKGEMYPCKPDIFEATYEAV